MREIKFRAWDKDEKKMLFENDMYMIGNPFTVVWVANGDQDYRFNDKKDGSKDEFIPMQYTGLKDKNGNEIYEGDVFAPEPGDDYHGFVKWNNRSACWCIDWGGGECDDFGNYHMEGFEIIGNICENPELITK